MGHNDLWFLGQLDRMTRTMDTIFGSWGCKLLVN
jgi:hypothetical protein